MILSVYFLFFITVLLLQICLINVSDLQLQKILFQEYLTYINKVYVIKIFQSLVCGSWLQT